MSELTHNLTDAALLELIETLRKAGYLGSWGQRELSKAEAIATSRKLKTKR